MYAPSDVADWVQEETSKQKAWFEEFAIDHPDYWIVIGLYGTEINTFIDINTGIVDVLRFGTGVAEGGAKGLLLDFLRAMAVADGVTSAFEPALARAAGRALAQDSMLLDSGKGRTCAVRALANALRRTGQKSSISLEEIAQVAGMDMATMVGMTAKEVEQVLIDLEIPYRNLGKARTLSNAVNEAGRRRGVVLIGLESVSEGASQFHQIYIEKVGGTVKFFDRDGVYNSLHELSRGYDITFDWEVEAKGDMLFVPNATMKGPNPVYSLFLTVQGIFMPNPKVSLDDMKREYEQFKAKKMTAPVKGPAAPTAPPAATDDTITVAKGNTLSGFSMSTYGTYDLWPLLWDINRQTVGGNPNRLTPGIRLKIPALSAFTGSQIADAKRRAPTWRNYPC
ncbi:MAG TPA: hypothetical protein VGH38_28950 [Bryobacteraceae bacterium]